MKILGVGLSRTGTYSLAVALRQLGFNTLHYDRERLNDILDGTDPKPDFRRHDDVDAVTDIPSAHFYRELQREIPPERLLVLDMPAGDGGEKLCGFLGLPAPDMPFPHQHRGEKRMREGTAMPTSP